jgi:hypothetical protein
MRRSKVFISSLVLFFAWIPALVLASPAAATKQAPIIVCPQESTITQPCCPPPTSDSRRAAKRQIVCCPVSSSGTSGSTTCCTTACCTVNCPSSGLTISSSPDPSSEGHKITISGVLESGASGTQITLWQELPGQTTFHDVASATTGSSGSYSITMARGAVKSNREWYVSGGGLDSSTITETVTARVVLASASASTTPGAPLALRGSVTPSHAGAVVLIEQSVGGHWRVIARPKLNRSSDFKVSHSFKHAGTMKLRAVLRASARNDTSDSSTLSVKVR